MRILIGFEQSATLRDRFADRGWNAWSCDLEDAEGAHFKEDVFDVLAAFQWDAAILHPPCTRLANSGVRWLHERNLWDELDDAAHTFERCLSADVPLLAVENPIMHRHAKERIANWRKPDQIVQPWMFGSLEQKATCLWLRGFPKLEPTHGRPLFPQQSVWKAPPTKDRWLQRSILDPYLADAIADQWTGAA